MYSKSYWLEFAKYAEVSKLIQWKKWIKEHAPLSVDYLDVFYCELLQHSASKLLLVVKGFWSATASSMEQKQQ